MSAVNKIIIVIIKKKTTTTKVSGEEIYLKETHFTMYISYTSIITYE